MLRRHGKLLATQVRLAGCPLKLVHLPTALDRFDLLFLQRANIVTNTRERFVQADEWTIQEGNDTMTLSSRIALVTGGGSGIGRATCLRLARDGRSVGILGIDGKNIAEVVRETTHEGGRAFPVQADASGPR